MTGQQSDLISKQADGAPSQTVCVASVQYQLREIESFEDFADHTESFLKTAGKEQADFVVFPEYFSLQLLSIPKLQSLIPRLAIETLAENETDYILLLSRLAEKYNTHIIGGSHPIVRNSQTLNASPIIYPDGTYHWQTKLHITPWERENWNIKGGSRLTVFETPKAKVSILICYDSEFPEAARYLSDQGVDIIFVPYCTDDQQGHQRVRICSRARAIENQIYVITSGLVGNLASVSGLESQYAKSGAYSPSDIGHPNNGIIYEIADHKESILLTKLDLNDLYNSRMHGSVKPLLDRRHDLFHQIANVEGTH